MFEVSTTELSKNISVFWNQIICNTLFRGHDLFHMYVCLSVKVGGGEDRHKTTALNNKYKVLKVHCLSICNLWVYEKENRISKPIFSDFWYRRDKSCVTF